MLSISSQMLSISSWRRLEASGGAPEGAQKVLEAPRKLLGGPKSDFWHCCSEIRDFEVAS